MIELPYSVAGFAVGAIVGLTGVGGGSLMTPLLVLGFGVPPVAAVGTDLLYAGITKAGGSVSHALKGHVDWRIAGLLAAGSVPATVAAIALLAVLPPAGAATRLVVSTTLGAMLVLTALALIFRARLLAWAQAHAGRGWVARHRRAATLLTGAFIGFAVTFSSVGAGAVGVTALVLLYPALATVRIVGSDIAHAVPITLLAGLGHLALGNVDGWLLASLLVGSLPGILAGAQLASRLPERVVRHSLVAVLLLAGTKLVLH
ncbi:MAG TPA: sulfite exporter TauE/SafE family protein [Usitatibacter sp.]|nr:sulfite exporter TauE/SafE family protein [Usitatibacter sp.]